MYSELLAAAEGAAVGERERAKQNALGMVTQGVWWCLSAARRRLPGAALEMLFHLAVGFGLAPAPSARVVQGAGRGFELKVEADILRSRWHTCAPPLHSPSEAL